MRFATSHRRLNHSILAAALTALAAAVPAMAQSDAKPDVKAPAAKDATPLPSAKDVVAKMIEFQGGEKAMADVRSSRGTGSFSVPMMNLNGSLKTWSSPPNLMFIEMDIPAMGGKSMQGFNGTVGWSIDPINGAQLLDGEMLKTVSRDANLRGDLDIFKMYDTVTVTGREKFEDVDCVVLELKTGDLVSQRYIDAETGRMVGAKSIMPTPQGDIPVETVIAEWKTVDGRNYPIDTRMRMMGMEQVMKIDTIEIGPVDAKKFDLPPAIAALVADAKAKKADEGDEKNADSKKSEKTAGE